MPGPIYPVLIISCCRERRPTSESRRYKHQKTAILIENSNRDQFKALFCKTHSVEVVPPKLVLLHFLWDQLIPAKNKMENPKSPKKY